jgi:hypothetical protein
MYKNLLLSARESADKRFAEKGLNKSSLQSFSVDEGKLVSQVSTGLVNKRQASDTPEVEQDDFLTKYYNRLYEQNKDLKEQSSVEGGEAEFVGAFNLPKELSGKKGVENAEVASFSYFNSSIVDRKFKGNSRAAGDVSPEVQQRVIMSIINEGSRAGLTDREIAITLAIGRHESGFNPDASAKSSSATGIGQFIDDTGTAYGINDSNRWDLDAQVDALVNHVADNAEAARKKGYGEEYIYALHHDGPALDRTGLSKSKKNVMPYVDKYLKLIKDFRGN